MKIEPNNELQVQEKENRWLEGFPTIFGSKVAFLSVFFAILALMASVYFTAQRPRLQEKGYICTGTFCGM